MTYVCEPDKTSFNMTWVFFLSLLALACGDLIIDIDIDVTHDKAIIDVRGNIAANIISDTERKTFGIEDEQLKNAVETYTNDSTRPDYVYVKAGENNDLYAKHKWLKVKRYIAPKYLDLKPKITCKPVEVIPPNMAIRTNWTLKGDLTVTDKINHIVYFDGKNFSTVNSEWGKNKIIQIPIKIEAGYEYKECAMNVELEYEATIAGDVAADYTKKRTTEKEGTHYFWAYDLKNVQNAAKLKNSIITTEIITVTYLKKGNI